MAVVHDRLGNKWSARRRWMPWRRRGDLSALDLPSFDMVGGDDPISLALNVVMLVLLVPVLLMAIFVAAESLLLLLLLPLWVLARTLFGTPWIIVVRRNGKVLGEEAVRGWDESGERIRQIVQWAAAQ